MSPQVVDKDTADARDLDSTEATATEVAPSIRHQNLAAILALMTFRERINAYEKGVFSHHELNAAAAREPDRMPHLNGDFEWMAAFLADLD